MPYAPPALPADLVAPCAPVPEFDSQSWDDLAVAFIGLTVEYAKCAARHDATVRAYDGLR